MGYSARRGFTNGKVSGAQRQVIFQNQDLLLHTHTSIPRCFYRIRIVF